VRHSSVGCGVAQRVLRGSEGHGVSQKVRRGSAGCGVAQWDSAWRAGLLYDKILKYFTVNVEK
jgi:hypothetical protein